MTNILYFLGFNLQSELCLWTILGLLTTIFDATLFKVDSNLKQVWQMQMPPELSMSMQRFLRSMISGVMLVQCFTLYVHLATYIVLLYPVFLEEKPALVLPWLLLAAVRKLLCELTSLALGLGICVLLGAARTPCIRFLLVKLLTIAPSFYLWMHVLEYYFVLKLAVTSYRMSVKISPSRDTDYGLEMALRRRRTKSLLHEEVLRQELVSLGRDENSSRHILHQKEEPLPDQRSIKSDKSFNADVKNLLMVSSSVQSNRRLSENNDDEPGIIELNLPRDVDRVLEQIVVLMFKISSSLDRNIDPESLVTQHLLPNLEVQQNMECSGLAEDSPPPIEVGNTQGSTALYIKEFPQIFQKKSMEKPLDIHGVNVFPQLSPAQTTQGQTTQSQATQGQTTQGQMTHGQTTQTESTSYQDDDPQLVDKQNLKQLLISSNGAVSSIEVQKTVYQKIYSKSQVNKKNQIGRNCAKPKKNNQPNNTEENKIIDKNIKINEANPRQCPEINEKIEKK